MNMRITVLASVLALLLAVLAVISYVSAPAPVMRTENDLYATRPIPPPRPEDMIAAQDPAGFQLLVSYTDRGFEPSRATIKVGDKVRFTNNSSHELWVAASGEKLYPAKHNGCGSSALDSCAAIEFGRHWEFTFGEAGTWHFANILDASKTGSIVVQ